MTRPIILAATVWILPAIGCAAQEVPNRLTEEEEAAGFQMLFDGTSLAEWKGFREGDVPSGWTIEDGAIHLTAEGEGGDIVTRRRFSDFDLRLEWRISEGGNSGIMFRVSEEKARTYETGPEMQILDDLRHRDGRVPETSAGSNFGLHAPSAAVAHPPGQWNRVRIVARGSHIEYWLNGVRVIEYELWTPDWEERVAATKFADWPSYGRIRDGHIALQDHGDEVWYRNLRIRPLSESSSPSESAFRLLVFSRTEGYRHGSIEAAVDAVRRLGREGGFGVEATEETAVFRTGLRDRYDVVVFLSTTGDVLDDSEQAAFEAFIRAGGGYVGVHAAADTEYEWPWYGELVGAWFARHPTIQRATIRVVDGDHPSTRLLGPEWARTDEWYDFRRDPGEFATVLLDLDESTYRGGRMGASHPIAWYRDFDGGRSWYTGLGHTAESWEESQFLSHLLGGIRWAAGAAAESGQEASQ